MKALLLVFFVSVAHLHAVDVASLMAKFGPAKEMTIEGILVVNAPSSPFRELHYKTKDLSKIAAIKKWLGKIPCEVEPWRFHGTGPKASADECIIFHFIRRHGNEHAVAIIGSHGICVDADWMFDTHDPIDRAPFFKVTEDLKEER